MEWQEKYMMLFLDWIEQTEALTDAEKGRLIDVLVKYFRGDGDWQARLKGNEQFVFPVFKAQLDRQKAQREKARESGRKGSQAKRSERQHNNNNNKNDNKDEHDNENEHENQSSSLEEEEDIYQQSPQGIAGAIAREWLRDFGKPANPKTVEVLALWAQRKGYDRPDFIEEAITAAALRNASDPVGYIIALFKDWRSRGINEVEDLD